MFFSLMRAFAMPGDHVFALCRVYAALSCTYGVLLKKNVFIKSETFPIPFSIRH
jgi:hypothetical protein